MMPRSDNRCAWVAVGLMAVVGVGIVLIARGGESGLKTAARRAWKDQSIVTITTQVSDATTLDQAIENLGGKHAGSTEPAANWIGTGLVIARNGDWLACRNVCSKEGQHIRDLFIACGSDGRWYYSTWHFCKQMVALRMDDQAESLIAFVKAYYLREFDGKSDQCLQATWPKESR